MFWQPTSTARCNSPLQQHNLTAQFGQHGRLDSMAGTANSTAQVRRRKFDGASTVQPPT
ncbi:hypothetical protein HPC62_10385 [Thermoleptolyngbya sichuanensis A183]|uniref:Uncharacterized protein n=1 Tax=Thermoleptolyngbya sichuanensis A183 TaxID=2737172 RepID=A0A6M8BJC9_9CYAN|nr:hypothetical protein [Thermoleptolyngbya sichuanensis]QKD82535.1 hypothetical protein HPC62_10385 [Thermoleptolyngbya sichuanensis A183]